MSEDFHKQGILGSVQLFPGLSCESAWITVRVRPLRNVLSQCGCSRLKFYQGHGNKEPLRTLEETVESVEISNLLYAESSHKTATGARVSDWRSLRNTNDSEVGKDDGSTVQISAILLRH